MKKTESCDIVGMLISKQEEVGRYEAHQDIDHQKFEGVHEKGRLRRVPDFLSVRMQDLLHRWQSALRKGKISTWARAEK